MTKYKSLFAALEPHTAPDGRRGSLVRCTATLRELGFVWWSADGGNTVTWHFRVGGAAGRRTTERNAVQALRDASNATSNAGALLPFEEPIAPLKPAVRATQALPAPAAAPRPAQRIVWDDAAPAFDIAAALAAGLKKGGLR